MESGGIQALYDPRIGETTIFPKDIEVGEGETPLRAVARIILHERPARNLLEMISAKPLYLNTKKGRNWLRVAGKQYAGTRGFQSGFKSKTSHLTALQGFKANRWTMG